MTEHEIRLATLEDACGLAEVHVRSWQSAYAGIVPQPHLDSLSVKSRANQWRENLKGGAFRTYVAVSGSEVVGFASVGESRDGDHDPGDVEVPAIYIHPSHWTQGIGRSLWRRVVEDAAKDGARTVSAWVLKENQGARAFYERIGCVDSGATKTLQIGGEDLTAVRYTQALVPSDR